MSTILEGTPKKQMMLVTGRAYPQLAEETAKYLGIDVLETTAYDFANGEMYAFLPILQMGRQICQQFLKALQKSK